MEKIRFQKIHLENCGCHSELDYTFPEGSLVGIVGKNGRGKSTIFKSLMVGLFSDTGEARESTNVGDLVNRKRPKDLLINIFWTVDGVSYEVRKYQNHKKHRSKMLLLKEGEDISSKSVTETHKKIESILVSKHIFRNTVYFSQQMKDFFTALANADQKKIFNAIFDFSIWEERQKHTDKLLKEEKRLLECVEHNLLEVSTKIPERDSLLKRLKQMELDKEKELEIDKKAQLLEVDVLTEQIATLKQKVVDINYDKSGHEELQQAVTELKVKHSNLKKDTDKEIQVAEDSATAQVDKLKIQAKSVYQDRKAEVEKTLQPMKDAVLTQLQEIDTKLADVKDKMNQAKTATIEEFNIISSNIKENLSHLNTERREIVLRLKAIEEEGAKVVAEQLDSEMEIKQLNSDEEVKCTKCDQIIGSQHKAKVLTDLAEIVKRTESERKALVTEQDKLRIDFNKVEEKSKEARNDLEQQESRHQETISRLDRQLQTALDACSDTRDILVEEDEKILDKERETVEEVYKGVQEEYKQLISEQINNKDKVTNELQNSLEKRGKTIYNNIKELEKKLNIFEGQKTETDNLQESITSATNKIEFRQSQIADIEKYKFDETEIKSTQEDLKKLKSEEKKYKTDKKSVEEMIQIYEFWKEGFSDRGIKSMLIDGSLPYLNQVVREELERLAPGKFILTFDSLSETGGGNIRDKFKVHILNTETGADKHKLLSGGEKRIIDVSTLMGLRKLTESIHGKSFNILLLDEVLDSLDTDNAVSYLKILKRLSDKVSVSLVTHNLINANHCDETYQL